MENLNGFFGNSLNNFSKNYSQINQIIFYRLRVKLHRIYLIYFLFFFLNLIVCEDSILPTSSLKSTSIFLFKEDDEYQAVITSPSFEKKNSKTQSSSIPLFSFTSLSKDTSNLIDSSNFEFYNSENIAPNIFKQEKDFSSNEQIRNKYSLVSNLEEEEKQSYINDFNIDNLTNYKLNENELVSNLNKSSKILNYRKFQNKNNVNLVEDLPYLNKENEKVLKKLDEISKGEDCNFDHPLIIKWADKINQDNSKQKMLNNILNPKFVEFPKLIKDREINLKLNKFYKDVIEKLKLISYLFYDNSDQIDTDQHLKLTKKIMREMKNLNSDILRARLILLDTASKKMKKRSNFNKENLGSNYKMLLNKNFERLKKSDEGLIETLNAEIKAQSILTFVKEHKEPIQSFKNLKFQINYKTAKWLHIENVENSSAPLENIKKLLEEEHIQVYSKNERIFAGWTNMYFDCILNKWLSSFTILLVSCNNCKINKLNNSFNETFDMSLLGILSVDFSLNNLDINQCSDSSLKEDYSLFDTLNVLNKKKELVKLDSQKSHINNTRLLINFDNTNKCHHTSSQCEFRPGYGLRKGGYMCKCLPGYYAFLPEFTGTEVENLWYEKNHINKKLAYLSPCLSFYNWKFRISLLTISILCICIIFVLTYYIHHYRKKKVFKVASPVFLSLTLLGCCIMYSEMIMAFPVLNTGFCIMVKLTRHMGFCITYSALLLKTWRVSLTYRVKSAHKLKLTDRQLLQWLFPILLVMAIFLGTWMVSSPPQTIMIVDSNFRKFKDCEYNNWDHCCEIGKFLFLLWGIKICYSVRNAESFFNEAKYITWAIYNITIVNLIMITIQNAGPDVKYFLTFLRSQLSTATTILLIFGPKFYILIKGEGDSWNVKVKARGINASFSLTGLGVVHEELTDLYQENEELKEQVHKLATKVEMMRLMQMQVNNRHFKFKNNSSTAAGSGSVTHSSAANSSVVVNSTATAASVTGLTAPNTSTANAYHSYSYNQLSSPAIDSAGIGLVTSLVGSVVGVTPGLPFTLGSPATSSCQRISPAAELQSEKV
uniref:G-protein coupled receptor 3 n=1 Tax=Polyphagotarsonemus latus TaxID=1204166 RepID=A0AAN0N5X7_9ACAR